MNELYKLNFFSILGEFKKQSAGFWWLCIYVIIEYTRIQTIYPALDVIPLAQISILIAILSTLSRKSTGPRVPDAEGISKLFYFYSFVIFLSSLLAYNSSVSFDSIVIHINWIILFVIIVKQIDTEKRFYLFLIVFFLVNLKMSQHAYRVWAERGFSFASWGLSGSPGWFKNSGEFAIEMCVFFPLAYYFIFSLRTHWSKAKTFALIFILPCSAILSVIGSSSRGGLIAMVFSVFYMSLFTQYKKNILLGIALLGVLVTLFLPEESKDRFRNIGKDSDSLHRLYLWEKGVDMYKRKPLFGVGYENYNIYYLRNYTSFEEKELERDVSSGTVEIVSACHNIFIQALSETGTIGIFVLFLLMLKNYRMNNHTRRLARENKDIFNENIALALNASMLAFIVGGQFVTILYYPFYWMNLAMSTAHHNVVAQKYHAQK